MTPLTLCWLTIPQATPAELVRAAAAGGFASAAIRMLEAGPADASFIGDNGALVPSLKSLANGEGIKLTRAAGFRLDGRAPTERYRRYVEAAAELAIDYVSIIGNDSDRARQTDHFAELCESAARHGMKTTIEFAPFTSVRTVEDADALIRRAGQPNATILVDTMHVHRSGGSAENLRRARPDLLSVVQLCDGTLAGPEPSQLLYESRNDRLDPGLGELPLLEMLGALPDNIAIEVEVPCKAYRDVAPAERAVSAAKAARAFLRDFEAYRTTRRPAAGRA